MKSSKEKFFDFSPKKTKLKDDAYHGSKAFSFTEWWYFDAELNDGYSLQMHLRVGSLLKNTIVLFFQKFELYKNKKLIESKRKIFHKKDVFTSKKSPHVKIKGKDVIKGQIDKKTGNWIYDLYYKINDTILDLKFEGKGNGYKGSVGMPYNKKGNTKQGKWAVILPFADVKGIIKLKDKSINVKGQGYHDHNWDMRGPVITNHGWLWGKIFTKKHAIVWAKVFNTKDISSNILIISKKNNEFQSFKSKEIKLVADDYKKIKNRLIPHHFNLCLKKEKIFIKIDMKSEGIHHQKALGITNYYRYHMRCKGIVQIESEKEEIDDILICEFLRFG